VLEHSTIVVDTVNATRGRRSDKVLRLGVGRDDER